MLFRSPSHSTLDGTSRHGTADSGVADPSPEPASSNSYLPTVTPTPQETTSRLQKEFGKLSVEERNQAYEDLHGVTRIVEETPDFVRTKLEAFQAVIDAIEEKAAYDLALSIDANYVNASNPKLRIMFLRADIWDSKLAAHRFVGWLEWKLELFGEKRLCKPYLTLDED